MAQFSYWQPSTGSVDEKNIGPITKMRFGAFDLGPNDKIDNLFSADAEKEELGS